jgi:hypothetical protein
MIDSTQPDTTAFDYRRFYALGEAFVRGAIRVHALGDIPDPFMLTRGDVEPRDPLRFHHDAGTSLKDYVGTTDAVLHLVSDRVVEALAGFTGWRTYPVEIYSERGDLVPGYHGLAATGRCGPIDDELSPVMVVPAPVPEGESLPHRIGLRFWPETWDGSDVFAPQDGSAWTLMTERARDALVAAKVTNVQFERITEIEQLVIPD